MRQKIRERVKIPQGEPGSLVESLSDSFFTGYMKIEFKKQQHIIVFDDGNIVKVLEVQGPSFKQVSPENYRIPSEGRVEVYETDPILITNLLRGVPEPERDRHLLFAGIGEPFQQSLPAKALNIKKITDIAQENSISGYILFHRNGNIHGIILFYEGKPVLVFDGKSYGDTALNTIRKSLSDSYVSILLIEPHIVPMVTSLGKPQIQRRGKIEKVSDLTSLLDSFRPGKLSALLKISYDEPRRTFILIFQGIPVATFQWTPYSFEETDLDSVIFPCTYDLFLLYVNPSPKEIQLSFEEGDSVEITLTDEDLERIKEAFISVVGSAGPALWNKVVSEEEIPERKVSLLQAERLIKKLALEIPKGNGRTEFLKRSRALLNQ